VSAVALVFSTRIRPCIELVPEMVTVWRVPRLGSNFGRVRVSV